MGQPVGPQFDTSYLRLPARFYAHQAPTPVASPELIGINRPLAEQLGISPAWLESEEGLAVLAGNRLAAGSQPVATVYAGHQFGGWNPRLGDGRAVLLGEVLDTDRRRYDLQLKGSGPTPYARGGDGRAPLGPVLREYVVSEAMARFGVPTSRSLAAVASGEPVLREVDLPGAILTRVASSHIRIGTFQYFAGQGDQEAVRELADYVIWRHFPEAAVAERPYLELLREVFSRQAQLIARWMGVGFIHGVMNTDNMLLCGETIDYGPCAFMDDFHPDTVYSSIDLHGRYAYRNQPHIAQWNLAWLARVLLPLVDKDEKQAVELAQQLVDRFPDEYQARYDEVMAAKLGLSCSDSSHALATELLDLMDKEGADYTLTFRRLAELAGPALKGEDSVAGIFELPSALNGWLAKWQSRLEQEARDPLDRQQQMLHQNPAFIPRNHLVEEVIQAAVQRQDFVPFHRLVERLAKPFSYQAADSRYALPPRPDQVVAQTFCGT